MSRQRRRRPWPSSRPRISRRTGSSRCPSREDRSRTFSNAPVTSTGESERPDIGRLPGRRGRHGACFVTGRAPCVLSSDRLRREHHALDHRPRRARALDGRPRQLDHPRRPLTLPARGRRLLHVGPRNFASASASRSTEAESTRTRARARAEGRASNGEVPRQIRHLPHPRRRRRPGRCPVAARRRPGLRRQGLFEQGEPRVRLRFRPPVRGAEQARGRRACAAGARPGRARPREAERRHRPARGRARPLQSGHGLRRREPRSGAEQDREGQQRARPESSRPATTPPPRSRASGSRTLASPTPRSSRRRRRPRSRPRSARCRS